MKLRSLLLFLFISPGCTLSIQAQDTTHTYEYLSNGFKKPPMSALPKVYWWWLNGDVNPARLKKELVDMKNAGIAGVDIFDIGGPEVPNPNNMIPAGPAFMGKESLEYIKTAVEEAGKLGMVVDLSVSSSWNAGGSWVKPVDAAKTLYFSKVSINGPKEGPITLPFPEITPDKNGKPRSIAYASNGRPTFCTEVAVLALPATEGKIDTSDIINVTPYFDPKRETLNWKAPNGKWNIYRYICANSGKQLNSPSPNSNGLVIDHFSPNATTVHFNYFIDKLKLLLGDFKKSALEGLYLASYEASDLHWTPTMPDAFKRMNNYDIYKFIPSIFNKNLFPEDLVKDFQFDFRKTKSEMMIENHYDKAREICNTNGLQLISESGGPGGWHTIPVEAIKALGAVNIPRGEFWNKYEIHDIGDNIDVKLLVKEIAAASHIYKRDLVEQESFTSWQNWQEGPEDLKPLADRAFCEGMNRLVIHGFSHEPTFSRSPGIGFYAGTHFNDRNTWWPKVRPFNEYLGRVSFILQNSRFVSDVLYYNGDDVPGLVPPKNTHFKVGDGYDYEIVNSDILLHQLTVKNGLLSLPGVGTYKLLCIGDNTGIDPHVLKKLTQLASEGALIIGAKPEHTEGLSNRKRNDSIVKALADNFWLTAVANEINASSFKKGVIYSNILPLQALKEIEVLPDFSYLDPESSSLDYIHFAKDSIDFYYIRNTTDRWISRECLFRQMNRRPEIWKPVSGGIYQVPLYQQRGQQISLPLTLAPHESYFVTFKPINTADTPKYSTVLDEDRHTPRIEYTENGFYLLDQGEFKLIGNKGKERINNLPVTLRLKGNWKVTFPKNHGAPESVTFPELMSWTEFPDKGVNYFSGIATYHKSFNYRGQRKGKVYLDLGNLSDVADVWLNGEHLGITWTKPFRFDVTKIIKDGENSLKVEIANTWSNRLIGDAINNEHYAQTNISKGNPNLLLHQYLKPNNVEVPWAQIPLRRSGLFGPVTIENEQIFQ